MKSVLVAHPWMARGGSEAAAMWTLEALQEDHQVTLATLGSPNWDELNAAYGTSVDPSRISVSRPRITFGGDPAGLVELKVRWFERFCQAIAHDFDFCLSAYNPIDFGRPGIQLIGDFSFSDSVSRSLAANRTKQLRHREGIARRAYLAVSKWIGVKERLLKSRGDSIFANSRWTQGMLAKHFGIESAPILYPPVVLPEKRAESIRDPFGFVCLGRIAPEKSVDRVVRILNQVRERGFPVELHLIGSLDDSDFSRTFAKEIEVYDWIIPEGFLNLEHKQALISSQSFALHACQIEAFGIAVAEMAALGCIPFVPKRGGSSEIVPIEALTYDSEVEAVDKICRLLSEPTETEALRGRLAASLDRFGSDAFMKQLRQHLAAPEGVEGGENHGTTQQVLAAAL